MALSIESGRFFGCRFGVFQSLRGGFFLLASGGLGVCRSRPGRPVRAPGPGHHFARLVRRPLLDSVLPDGVRGTPSFDLRSFGLQRAVSGRHPALRTPICLNHGCRGGWCAWRFVGREVRVRNILRGPVPYRRAGGSKGPFAVAPHNVRPAASRNAYAAMPYTVFTVALHRVHAAVLHNIYAWRGTTFTRWCGIACKTDHGRLRGRGPSGMPRSFNSRNGILRRTKKASQRRGRE
jgi:hypothetical protein